MLWAIAQFWYLIQYLFGIANVRSAMFAGGARADGTDDSAAFQAALNSGLQVLVPPGNYTILQALTRTSAGPIVVRGMPGAVLDGTGSVVETLVTLGGSRGPGAAMGADVVKGATVIQTALAVNPGDILLITSTDLWNPSREYYYKGELVEVRSVEGGNVTLKSLLYDGYTAATTTVYKLVMPAVEVSGLDIRRNSNHAGLHIAYGREVILSNCKVSGARERGLYLSYCFGGTVEKNYVTDCYYAGSGTSYGLCVSSSQGITETQNRIFGGRHAIAHGGWEPCRGIIVGPGNVLDNIHESAQCCMDFHDNCELGVIHHNVILNGIVLGSGNFKIHDNLIKGDTLQSGVLLFLQQPVIDFIEIRNNRIETKRYAVDVQFTDPNIYMGRLDISGNIIRECILGIVFDTSEAGCTLDRFILHDNDVETAQLTVVGKDPDLTVNLLEIRGGRYRAKTNHCMYMAPGSGGLLTVDGVHLRTDALNVKQFVTVTNWQDIRVTDCKLEGNPAALAYGNQLTATNSLRFERNHVLNNSVDSGTNLTATEIVFAGNRFTNVTGNPKLTGRVVMEKGSTGNVVAWASAVPAAGTWAKGDMVFNSSPAAGGPSGWRCTVAGTPGTWEPFGTVGETQVVLKAPNGDRYAVTVDNTGALVTTKL